MCCFTKPIQRVSETNLFARMGDGIEQFVVYSMSLKAAHDLAMVLPIPVAKGSGEKAVKFISFEKYPKFFEDMVQGFPVPARRRYGPPDPFGPPRVAAAKLEVHSVGAFDASFVPSIADFGRLDERFRLPAEVWQKLPGYQDFGFAVFKLKAGDARIHPMAFSFPSAMPNILFFPTLHIHDGEVHAKADFDHAIYCQATGLKPAEWQESPQLAIQFIKCGLTQGIVHPGHHVFKREMRGLLANGDLLVNAARVAT